MKKIALTFDDGPSLSATGRILTALEKAGAKATFFVVGCRVADYPQHLRRMAADGFQIGNHTWNHELINHLTENELQNTVRMTSDAIRAVCGITPSIMRPPGGAKSPEAIRVLGSMGYAAIFWNVDPRDWDTLDARSTIDHVLSRVRDGDIVIMHDLYEPTAEAAEVIIPELVRQGYALVTVDELCEGRGTIVPGNKYFHF